MDTQSSSATRPSRPEYFDYEQFDPTVRAQMHLAVNRPSVGRTPSGFPKIHAELLPLDLMRLIGYDPRSIEPVRGKKSRDPQNISPEIITLHRSVQRSIDQSKVDEMVEYLHRALSTGRFADWSEIDVATAAKPDMSKYQNEFVVVFPHTADYLITDGQHRYCAILDFVRRYPEYANSFTQAVAVSVLPIDKLGQWAGQSFHDKNFLRTPVKITKALAADTRDLHNRIAKSLRENPVIEAAGGVNETRDNLPPSAKEFATHSLLYKFARAVIDGRQGLDRGTIANSVLTEDTYDQWEATVNRYMEALGAVMPSWTVDNKEKYLSRSSAAIQALGVIGNLLYTKVTDDKVRMSIIQSIGKLDWKRTNKQWDGVLGHMKGDVVGPTSSRQSVDGAIKFLRDKTGLSAYIK